LITGGANQGGEGRNGREMGGIFGGSGNGDYDHCINALRQLQKRITVVLIYDSKKELMKQEPQVKKIPQIQEIKTEEKDELLGASDFPDMVEDSQMEDESNDNSSPLEPTPLKKKGVSHHPALMNLAGSLGKDAKSSAIEK